MTTDPFSLYRQGEAARRAGKGFHHNPVYSCRLTWRRRRNARLARGLPRVECGLDRGKRRPPPGAAAADRGPIVVTATARQGTLALSISPEREQDGRQAEGPGLAGEPAEAPARIRPPHQSATPARVIQRSKRSVERERQDKASSGLSVSHAPRRHLAGGSSFEDEGALPPGRLPRTVQGRVTPVPIASLRENRSMQLETDLKGLGISDGRLFPARRAWRPKRSSHRPRPQPRKRR